MTDRFAGSPRQERNCRCLPTQRERIVVVGGLAVGASATAQRAIAQDASFKTLTGEPATSGLERQVRDVEPTAVLVDEKIGYAPVMRLNAIQSRPAVIVFARAPTELYVDLLAAVGVSCVPMRSSATEMLAVIREAAAGDHARLRRLTPREREILERLKERETDGAIALDLGISHYTVKKHTSQILRKLGLRSKREIPSLRAPSRIG
jgi:DNA-binding NarL/FixJ family response regulator